MMDNERPVAALPYATPTPKRPRRRPRLPPSLAIAAVICGTVLIATPAITVSMMSKDAYGISGDVWALLWATGGAGLGMVLLGIFLVAPSASESRSKRG
jgi:uncharacterized RDD family membrane protein YckC